MSKTSRILITCAKGIPPLLKAELQQLGLPILLERIAGVETEGTLEDTQRLNLRLRTGQRVLWLVRSFLAATPDQLYAETVQIPWEEYIPADGYLCVNSSVTTAAIRDFRFATLKCKDAIVDRIREKAGRRPNSGSDQNRTVVFLYWKDRQCNLYLDTSGEPLSRRGYRKIPLRAPMQETLAAAVILATGWDGQNNFVNPMCGSGTLAIEAALIGLRRAPGLLRGNFGFMHIRGFRPEGWDELRSQARRAAAKTLRGRIVATDIDPKAVTAAQQNARTAGVEHLIDFNVCDFAATPIPAGGGLVLLNPEYGERLGEFAQLEGVYRDIGNFFKQKCGGYMGYVFTGNLDLAKKLGLRTKRKDRFFNGEIECRLLGYELYAGTRRRFGQARTEAGAGTGCDPGQLVWPVTKI